MRAKLFFLASALVNVVFFQGDPDESLSARAWREGLRGSDDTRRRIDRWFGPGHCEAAHRALLARQQARK